MRVSFQARVVFPVDRPPIECGVVTIERERIAGVGAAGDRDAPIRDLGNVALLPGLINAHTHLEFSHLTRPLGRHGMKLVDWIRLVINERQGRRSPATDSITDGVLESARAGVTVIGDIANGEIPLTNYEASQSSPIVPFRLPFLEVIGFSRARAASALAAVTQELDAMSNRTGDDCNPGARRVGISPHAPYTVSPDLVRSLVALAMVRNLPVAMHVAESAEEIELLRHGTGPLQELLDERSMWDAGAVPRGSRPMDSLRMLADAPRALVIHGNYLDEKERDFLASHADRMTLVYCPRTHAYFGHPPYPLADVLQRGVRVALGTDSRASNPDLDLWAEMRHVALSYPTMDPATILRMATLDAATGLGFDDQTGSLTTGKRANMIAIPLPNDACGRPSDWLGSLLASPAESRIVWVAGHELR